VKGELDNPPDPSLPRRRGERGRGEAALETLIRGGCKGKV